MNVMEQRAYLRTQLGREFDYVDMLLDIAGQLVDHGGTLPDFPLHELMARRYELTMLLLWLELPPTQVVDNSPKGVDNSGKCLT